MKLVNESRKIMGIPELKVTATAVRVPVVGGHSESVNMSFRNSVSLEAVLDVLKKAPGVVLLNDVGSFQYPMPLLTHGKDEVYVGRVRIDESQPNSINLWIVADNLRKGAATNAVQILELVYN
jgi:aspartate-semialdehyde dehydrogenase